MYIYIFACDCILIAANIPSLVYDTTWYRDTVREAAEHSNCLKVDTWFSVRSEPKFTVLFMYVSKYINVHVYTYMDVAFVIAYSVTPAANSNQSCWHFHCFTKITRLHRQGN